MEASDWTKLVKSPFGTYYFYPKYQSPVQSGMEDRARKESKWSNGYHPRGRESTTFGYDNGACSGHLKARLSRRNGETNRMTCECEEESIGGSPIASAVKTNHGTGGRFRTFPDGTGTV